MPASSIEISSVIGGDNDQDETNGIGINGKVKV
jgi:hypothetical protein